ncbi:hypothetical protein O0I10_006498 [Lichtheimia ornata]|uniref:Uncharacterized protein n=1 Tax=Lichtheimia ornata TaxID=688661 RepID=A0AAD7XYI9_9FUNG|nr:uncharacterized protein O0I10_006498 [Lichtheimia ornata]KAJ8657683.1 hypothetical protein O0I10_006498 [Lichtheimia ornata]
MDAIKCNDEKSWKATLITCRVVSRNDGSHHVDTAKEDGFDKCFTAMDHIGILEPMHAAAISQSWMKDVYDDSEQEYNGIMIPVDGYTYVTFKRSPFRWQVDDLSLRLSTPRCLTILSVRSIMTTILTPTLIKQRCYHQHYHAPFLSTCMHIINHSWPYLLDANSKHSTSRMMDGLGQATTAHGPMEAVLLEASGSGNREQNAAHSLNDTIRLLECATNSLLIEMHHSKAASCEIYTVFCV